MYFSIIVPVYNRPAEVEELLESLVLQRYKSKYEIIIIEDGSTISCNHVVEKYKASLDISYFYKANSGPGDSRNFGMKNAKGDFFLIFDSDCIIPENYLVEVSNFLDENHVDFFGGPDNALPSFSAIQKAINFTMTSFFTTGGVRGGSEKIDTFQPRSFNMGISKKAFESSSGFSNIHPGEDPDLTIRLWKLGFKSKLIPSAFVYHKRRINWTKFYTQVNKFGLVRPILNSKYPEFSKFTYWFPSLFIIGFTVALLFWLFSSNSILLALYLFYFIVLFMVSSFSNKSIQIGLYSIVAVIIQFFGYGYGFIESYLKIVLLKKKPEIAFPNLFY